MVTTYIIILAISAWLIAYGLGWSCARITRLLHRPSPLPEGSIAFAVAFTMLIIVAAPAWLFLALVGMALLPRFIHKPSLRIVLLIVALPLAASPLLGAATGFALDAALIAAAVMGESHAA